MWEAYMFDNVGVMWHKVKYLEDTVTLNVYGMGLALPASTI